MQIENPIIEGKHEAQWITISNDEYESMKPTVEVLSDSQLMEQIRDSLEDIDAGRVKDWVEFAKELKLK